MTGPSDRSPSAPFCSNCGYSLTGLTESSKCPECGRPLVEVLVRPAQSAISGKRWRSRAQLFGWPVIDIAMGPRGMEMRGRARGIIAIGDVAVGGVAIGGVAMGGITLGGVSAGCMSFGGVALGLLAAMGGLSVGLFAFGGMAIGALAVGGQAMGVVAVGGQAVGLHSFGQRGYNTPEARQFFGTTWLLLGAGAKPVFGTMMLALTCLGGMLMAASVIGLISLQRVWRDNWAKDESAP